MIIMLTVSGATEASVFRSGSWYLEMAAGGGGRSSRNVLALVGEASCSQSACVTIPSELRLTLYHPVLLTRT